MTNVEVLQYYADRQHRFSCGPILEAIARSLSAIQNGKRKTTVNVRRKSCASTSDVAPERTTRCHKNNPKPKLYTGVNPPGPEVCTLSKDEPAQKKRQESRNNLGRAAQSTLSLRLQRRKNSEEGFTTSWEIARKKNVCRNFVQKE